MERAKLGVSLRDKIRNEVICQRTKVIDIALKVRLKWPCAGHICHRTENPWSKHVLESFRLIIFYSLNSFQEYYTHKVEEMSFSKAIICQLGARLLRAANTKPTDIDNIKVSLRPFVSDTYPHS